MPGFLYSSPSWVPPYPHPQGSVAPPLLVQGGRHTRLLGRGCVDSIPTMGQSLWYSTVGDTGKTRGYTVIIFSSFDLWFLKSNPPIVNPASFMKTTRNPPRHASTCTGIEYYNTFIHSFIHTGIRPGTHPRAQE